MYRYIHISRYLLHVHILILFYEERFYHPKLCLAYLENFLGLYYLRQILFNRLGTGKIFTKPGDAFRVYFSQLSEITSLIMCWLRKLQLGIGYAEIKKGALIWCLSVFLLTSFLIRYETGLYIFPFCGSQKEFRRLAMLELSSVRLKDEFLHGALLYVFV